jgi:hypothetical protein
MIINLPEQYGVINAMTFSPESRVQFLAKPVSPFELFEVLANSCPTWTPY